MGAEKLHRYLSSVFFSACIGQGKLLVFDLSVYDGRHQWTHDAVDAGNALIDILSAGGWSKDSPMVRRYSGERTIASDPQVFGRLSEA